MLHIFRRDSVCCLVARGSFRENFDADQAKKYLDESENYANHY